MKRLDFRKANFTRNTEEDFYDDGNYFYGYIHQSGMPMSYSSYKDEAYISLCVDHLGKLTYDEYSKLKSYKDADMYNGIAKDQVDMAKLDAVASALMDEYNEAVNNLKAVDDNEWTEYVNKAKEVAVDKYNKARELITNNFDIIIDYSEKWKVKELIPYLSHLKEDIERVERQRGITDEAYKRNHLAHGIYWAVRSLEKDFYFNHIKETIEEYSK